MAFLEAAVISRPIISAHRLDDIRTVAGNNGDHQMVIDGLAAGNRKLVTSLHGFYSARVYPSNSDELILYKDRYSNLSRNSILNTKNKLQ